MRRHQDHAEWVAEQWTRERPDLDVSPQRIIGRLHRIAARLTEELVAEYARFGLGEGEFDILATLRRSGEPFQLTPSELARSTMVTSGAITKRIDRCVRQGWVSREVSPLDGRGRLIGLTPSGRDLIDAAFSAHIANEHRLLAELSARQRSDLERLLASWARILDV